MKDIIPSKKQSPILGLTGMGGGVGSNLSGGGAKKVYGDEIFSTYLYKGAGSGQVINNGIDNSGEGGMVWFKSRDKTYDHQIVDTIRGGSAGVQPNTDQGTVSTQYISSFNDNGFTLGNETASAGVGDDFASWNFRKTKGFFDVVTFQQSGGDSTTTPQVIPHNLGAVPGMILLKKTSGDRDWFVYHRDLGKDYWIKLNQNGTATNENNSWGTTTPDANNFGYMSGYIGGGGGSAQFVAYLFAGGAATGTGNGSVQYGGASINDYSYFVDSDNFNVGTNFTAECWFNVDEIHSNLSYAVIMGQWFDNNSNAWLLEYVGADLRFYYGGGSYKTLGTYSGAASLGTWHHVAISKEGSITRIFLDGRQVVDDFDMGTYTSSSKFYIGGHQSGQTQASGCLDGRISNLRVVKDTAVYTSSFRVPTEPLTGIPNTVILCCNDPTNARGTTVNTTGDYMFNGTGFSSPQPSTDTPFADPDCFKFGEEGDQNMIRCGSHSNPATQPTRIYTGWEPQWILLKNADTNGSWAMFDTMRGIFVNQDGPSFAAESNAVESGVVGNTQAIVPHADGFTLNYGLTAVNSGNGNKILYMAIRRPDGYVAKPPETGTEVYTQIYGNGAGTNPSYISNFPVDFALTRQTATSEAWYAASRLSGSDYMITNGNNAATGSSNFVFDHNNGWRDGGAVPNYLSWMWKRHAGFDVVAYKGNGTAGRKIKHNLSKTPEMIWIKNRDATDDWAVYHKGLNGGTNPASYFLTLNDNSAEVSSASMFNQVEPTALDFTLGTSDRLNKSNSNILAWFFASVDGISKVGSFAGSSSDVTLNLGFVPRLLIVKGRTGPGGTWWVVWDSTRGITGGGADTPRMYLNDSGGSQVGANDNVFTVDSGGVKGITIVTGPTYNNHQDYNYIYYAHA